MSTPTREEAYRANNLGVALLEQFKHREGAAQFRRALSIDPRLAIARINLSIALFNVPDIAEAANAARAAIEVAPDAPQPHYILGLIAKQQNDTDAALAEFGRVLKVDPQDVGANVNLGQVYAQARNYKEAIAAFRTAVEAEPYNGTALYNLATAMLRSGQRDEGQQLMQRFQKLRESGAATITGQNYLEQGRYAEAVTSTGAEPELFDTAMPRVSFVDATATVMAPSMRGNNLFGEASERNTQAGTLLFDRQLVSTQYDKATQKELAASTGGVVTLFDFDGDGDLDLLDLVPGDQRLYRNDKGQFVDVTSNAGALKDALASDVVNVGAVAGDYDNDGRVDLFVLRYGKSALYHNDGGGKFSDRTSEAVIPLYPFLSLSCAFVDVDHDGDLDIFIAGFADLNDAKYSPLGKATGALNFPRDFAGAPNMLLRNNGNGTFTDITAQAKVGGESGHAVAIVPTDYDNRRDVDLLVVNYGALPSLYRNLRDGTFRDIAHEVGLDAKGNYTSVAAGDVNKDGFTDFFFGSSDTSGTFALSDGQGHFRLEPAPAASGDIKAAQFARRGAAQFLDYDNDGLLDLVTVRTTAPSGAVSVWRNIGTGWTDMSDHAVKQNLQNRKPSITESIEPRVLASGDVDGDGDTDLFVRAVSGQLRFMRNIGGNRNHSLRVRLSGKVSNRSGVEAKIEMRAGSLRQKIETYAASPAPAPADIIFGLGQRVDADAVRVLWPSGVVQSETETASKEGAQTVTRIRAESTLGITELDRKPSSCPFLYAWNGERFEFITDFMGGGEMGDWVAPGVFNTPDSDEYVRIRGDQLRPRGGRYELRVTNELEEALFVDRLQLVAVAHPSGVEVYPNEGLGNPTAPAFHLYTTRGAHPPRTATDEHSHDILPLISHVDRRYPSDFRLARIRGYATEHTLTLDLNQGEKTNEANKTREDGRRKRETHETAHGKREVNDGRDGRTLLLLTGWTDYAFSSDNVAAAQSGQSLTPPTVQVRDAAGKWQTAIENIGIPVGRPQTVTVDLTGKFLSASREVRIVTNMRVYWDQILVDTSGGDFPVRMERLDTIVATLRERGFSATVTPDGREPFSYDYTRVSLDSPWKTFPGHYTRTGDVRELLRAPDDMFVVSRPGDELSISFDATTLAPLPAGWTRTFLLYADGFSKEMDINSASPHELAPLPFHGMKRYPYAAPEHYPMTPARQSYIERYNTRIVAKPVTELLVKR